MQVREEYHMTCHDWDSQFCGGFCHHRHATFGVFYKTNNIALCVSMP